MRPKYRRHPDFAARDALIIEGFETKRGPAKSKVAALALEFELSTVRVYGILRRYRGQQNLKRRSNWKHVRNDPSFHHRLLRLRKKGLLLREIAAKLNVDLSTVKRNLRPSSKKDPGKT